MAPLHPLSIRSLTLSRRSAAGSLARAHWEARVPVQPVHELLLKEVPPRHACQEAPSLSCGHDHGHVVRILRNALTLCATRRISQLSQTRGGHCTFYQYERVDRSAPCHVHSPCYRHPNALAALSDQPQQGSSRICTICAKRVLTLHQQVAKRVSFSQQVAVLDFRLDDEVARLTPGSLHTDGANITLNAAIPSSQSEINKALAQQAVVLESLLVRSRVFLTVRVLNLHPTKRVTVR